MKHVNKLVTWYENLSPQSLEDIKNYYDQDSYFKDPFNEVNDREKIKIIFAHMFDNLEQPRFKIIEHAGSEEKIFLIWDFSFRSGKKSYNIHGSSLIKFNPEGLVCYHRDYWDVGEEVLRNIPFIGYIYNKLCKKLSSSAS